LGVRTEVDSILSVLAPLGLAAAAHGPCLLIDLDSRGPQYPSKRSLAELVADGPTRAEIAPDRRGVALLRNGGIAWTDAAEIVERLASTWGSVCLRVSTDQAGLPWPVIPVVPLLPGFLAPRRGRSAVWQASARGQVAPGPGPLLPPLGRRLVHSLLEARFAPHGRWIRSWHQVWELPWP
jgi:hypothetical protein